jgi:hypothetical protein
MKLDRDERDAFMLAGARVLQWIGWLVCLVGLVGLLRALVGCGGAEFQGLGPIPVEAGAAPVVVVDAGELAPETSSGEARAAIDPPDATPTDLDAGARAQDAGTTSDPPRVDAGEPPPEVDAGPPPPPPPPPALCCVTPCQGSSPAAITCGNGGDWTCAAGVCAAGACAVGAACTWMTTCAGRVEVCP